MSITDAWNIAGHQWAVDLLEQRLAADRLAHSILFSGAAGIGKTTLAVALARRLNCSGSEPPCGVCRACVLTERRSHPDLLIIEAEPGEALKIDRVRELQRAAALAPFEARHRVAIIRNVHAATAGAADALLKLVEEPPATMRLLLTADSVELVTPTLVSRCQIVALRPLAASVVEQLLIVNWEADPAQARIIAQLAGGRPGWAVRALNDPAMLAGRQQSLADLVELLGLNRAARFAYAEHLGRERERIVDVLDMWQAWWRDILLLAGGSSAAITNEDQRAMLEAYAQNVTFEGARHALKAVREAMGQLAKNANVRLVLEVMLLNFPYL